MRHIIGAVIVVSLFASMGFAQTATVIQDAPIYVVQNPPSTLSPLRVAAAGTVLRIVGEDGDWIKVEFQDPQWGVRTGWVKTAYVAIRRPEPEPMNQPVKPQPPPASTVASRPETSPNPSIDRGRQAAQEVKPLTNEDIVGLLKVGLGSALIVAKIASSPCQFDTSPAALQQLKAAGVPDDVLMAMLQPSVSATPTPPGRVKDEMTGYFQRLQNTVLTVWSETGHGTGFIVDPKGLILTNHHVIGPSHYIAVQFDPARKIPAVLLAADPLKDVAVIWADLSVLPEARTAPLAKSTPTVEEGERVFTIGSPLNQRKILTTGVASKVEARAILSDVNINPGNSGGPLFNSIGEVVGITTFGDATTRGPGVSGIVRIEEALPLLEKARAAMTSQPPKPVLLPVEPAVPFPIEAIKGTAKNEKLDLKPYTFGVGDYDVGVLTPVVLYRADEGEREAIRTKENRSKKKDEAFDPTANLYNWAEYAGEFRAVVTIRATPKLRETFWSSFSRGMAAAGGVYNAGPATLRFKTDFLRMELFCGPASVMPIHPGKIAHLVDVRNAYVKATDATYEGLYTYPVSAFSPECGEVVLKLFSDKDPPEVTTKILDKKTLDRVWMDFESWRQSGLR